MTKAQTQADLRFWVQAAGRVWGPYAPARIAAFVQEGRVAAETLLGLAEEGPFAPAAAQPELASLFGAQPAAEEAPAEPARAAAPANAGARALLVWAALSGTTAARLERALAAYGASARIGRDLWLVRAPLGPAALRNGLTRALGPQDALLVVEAGLADAAWFNLGGETDRAVRSLWAASPDR